MEEHQWTFPVWSKNVSQVKGENMSGLRYTYPDWGNTGPAVLPPSQHSYDPEDWWSQPSESLPGSSFTTSKDVQKKFPLKAVCPYSYPVLEPQRSFCQGSVPHCLVGNCIDVAEMGGELVVMHVDLSNEKQQAVVASRLKPGTYYENDEPIENSEAIFHLETWNSNVVVDATVHQVVSKSLHNNVHVVVRSPTVVHIAGLGETQPTSDRVKTSGGSLTSDAALSSVLPGLWALATVTGEITLHDATTTKPLWTIHHQDHKKVKNGSVRTYRCDFGRHPLNLLAGDENSVWLYDTRAHPDLHKPLFDKKDFKDCIPDHEQICSFVSAYDRPHVYLILDESVYVLDDRRRKTPLMHWRHMLPGRPSLSTLSRLDSHEILVLSCSQNKEVCMISSEWESGRQRCYGVSVPRHFPILHDTATFAHSNSLWFSNQVQDRLEGSVWLGAASFTHPTQNDNLLFLSLHNTGDIFLHSFQAVHAKTHSIITPDDQQGKAILSKWETDVVEVSTHKWSSQNYKFFDVSGFVHQVLEKPSSKHVEDLLVGLPEENSNHHNANTDKMNTEHSSRSGKNTHKLTNCEKGAKTNKNSLSESKKFTANSKKISQRDTSHVWNLRNYVEKSRKQQKYKSGKFSSWSKALMEDYEMDPLVDPDENFPVHFDDTLTEDCLGRFLPKKIAKNLKVEKIKGCEDFLSLKIASLWLDEGDSDCKDEEAETERRKSLDARLSTLVGIESSAQRPRRQGFRYHTAPVDLLDVCAKVSSAWHPPDNRDHTTQSPPPPSTQPSGKCSENVSSKSKITVKKRKRVDGF